MSNYLIESSICLAAFYTFYWVVLHREKLLNINRFYLLASVAISLIIPLLSIETSWTLFPSSESAALVTTPIEGQVALGQSKPIFSIGLIYGIGLAISIVVLITKLIILRRKLGQGFSIKRKHIEIVETEGKDAFSFYNTIYIGKELAQNQHLKEQVIAHEFAHIDGKHTLDTMFFELLKCFYWFNPFSYFYSKSAQLQHEFIADQFVLKKSDTKVYERSLLQLTLLKINPSLVASFAQHPIQKRLQMMKTINSNIMKRLKPLFALPVLGALVFALACTEEVSPESNEIVFEETEIPVDLQTQVKAENLSKIAIRLQGKLDSLVEFEAGKVVKLSARVSELDTKNEALYEYRLDESSEGNLQSTGNEFHFRESEIEVPNNMVTLKESEVQTVFVVKPDKSNN